MPTLTDISAIEIRLSQLGVSLPPPRIPVANYVGCKRSGDILHVAGQIGDVRGAVGSDVTVIDGQLCARQAVIYMLGTIKSAIGNLDQIASVDRLVGYVRSAPDFTAQPVIIDGASDLLIEIFGEAGRHTRTATGVLQTPFGASVQLEMMLRLK